MQTPDLEKDAHSMTLRRAWVLHLSIIRDVLL